MSWTGARPRKLSMNINFTKPTNRDGAKLIMVKQESVNSSPRRNEIEVGGG